MFTYLMQVGRVGEPWLGDYENRYYKAAADSIEKVWEKKPIFIKEGGNFSYG